MDNPTPLQEIQSKYKSNQNSTESLTQKNSNKLINFILLVLYSLYSLFLLDVTLNNTFQNGVSGILLMFLFPIYLFIFLYFASVIFSLLIATFSNKINIVAFIPMFSVTGIIIALSLLGDWNILPKIIGVIIILLSAYKIYAEMQLLNNKQAQNSDVSKSEKNNSYQDIISNTSDTNSPSTDTNTRSTEETLSTQPLNIIKNESIQLEPKQSESMVNSDNFKKTDPIQSIQEYYQTDSANTKTSTYIKEQSYSNKTLRIIISVFLVLGFLGFAFLSLGGIVAGDLTVSAVLMVALIITIIDALLFYFLWRK